MYFEQSVVFAGEKLPNVHCDVMRMFGLAGIERLLFRNPISRFDWLAAP